MPQTVIGLGANLGDRSATLAAALRRLDESPNIKVLARSAWRETPAVGGPANQSAYLNGAALLQASLDPEALLATLLRVEAACGRVRGERWSARTIDLDLLLYDAVVETGPRLTLPHPRLAFRRFVLEPAVEVAPRMVHPLIGWSLKRILQHLNESADYVAIASPAGRSAALVAEAVCARVGAIRLSLTGADSGGRKPATPIELLQGAEKLLDRSAWPRSRWVVSDFWAPQLLACIETLPAEGEASELRLRYHALSPRLTAPKLLIALDDSVAANEQPPKEQPPNDNLRQAFWRQVDRPFQGPVLRLPGAELELAVAESLAALDALRPLPGGPAHDP